MDKMVELRRVVQICMGSPNEDDLVGFCRMRTLLLIPSPMNMVDGEPESIHLCVATSHQESGKCKYCADGSVIVARNILVKPEQQESTEQTIKHRCPLCHEEK